MKRKLSMVFLAAVILITTFFMYASRIYFPKQLRQFAIKKAGTLLNRNVSIESVRFNPIRGFQLRHIIVFEEDSQREIFLHIENLSFNMLYFPILKNKKIVIPSITIRKAHAHLIRQKSKLWNFNDLLKYKGKGNLKGPLSFIVAKISILDSRIKLTDETTRPNFSEFIEDINLKANISFRNNIKFSLKAGKNTSYFPHLSVQGNFDLSSKKLISKIRLEDFDVSKYAHLYFEPRGFTLDNSILQKSDMVLIYHKGKLSLSSHSAMNNVQITFGTDKKYAGNPFVDLNIDYDPKVKKTIKYEGHIEPGQDTVTGLPLVGQVDILTGRIYFENNLIKTESLKGIAIDSTFELSGDLIDFNNPFVDINLSSDVELSKLRILFPEFFEKKEIEISGPAALTIDYKAHLKKPKEAEINIKADLDNAILKTPKLPKPIYGIIGKINYAQDIVVWKDLGFSIYETEFNTSATVKNLQEPYIKLEGRSKISLDKLHLAFPDLFEKEKVEIAGMADTKINFEGPIDNFEEADIKIDAMLKGASFNAEKIPEKIEDISGNIKYSNDYISWEDFKGFFKGHLYTLDGFVENFSRPYLETALKSDKLNFTTKVKILNNAIRIASLNGDYYNSKFDIRGHIKTLEYNNPELDLRGDLDISLQDLQLMLPNQKYILDKFNPEGVLNLKGSLKGISKEWRDWQVSMNATSKEISLGKIKVNGVAIELNQPEGSRIYQFDILGNNYDGTLNATLTADPKNDNIPLTAKINIKDINIAKLKKDTTFKDKEISGFFSGDLSANGYLKDINSIKGTGSVIIKDGYLWQLDLLKNFGQFLLIPEYSNIIFNEADGNFSIEDGRILTDDFELKSEPLNLICRGWVDFFGDLNFHLFSRFSKEMIKESTSLKKTITSILTHTDDYLTIRLTGTLKEPRYIIIPASVNVLEKTKDFILDSLQSILE